MTVPVSVAEFVGVTVGGSGGVEVGETSGVAEDFDVADPVGGSDEVDVEVGSVVDVAVERNVAVLGLVGEGVEESVTVGESITVAVEDARGPVVGLAVRSIGVGVVEGEAESLITRLTLS